MTENEMKIEMVNNLDEIRNKGNELRNAVQTLGNTPSPLADTLKKFGEEITYPPAVFVKIQPLAHHPQTHTNGK